MNNEQLPCLPDCPAQYTGDGRDCTCVERYDAAWDAEMERRVDEYLERHYYE